MGKRDCEDYAKEWRWSNHQIILSRGFHIEEDAAEVGRFVGYFSPKDSEDLSYAMWQANQDSDSLGYSIYDYNSRRLKVYDKKGRIYAVYKHFQAIKYANLTPIDARFLKRNRTH